MTYVYTTIHRQKDPIANYWISEKCKPEGNV